MVNTSSRVAPTKLCGGGMCCLASRILVMLNIPRQFTVCHIPQRATRLPLQDSILQYDVQRTDRFACPRVWGHYGLVGALAFSPCGEWIVSGSYDTMVKLWNSQTGAPGISLDGHVSGVRCVTYSPKGHQIAAGSEDGTIRIWDSTSGRGDLRFKWS